MTTKKRKKRLRKGRLLLVLIILGLIVYGIYKYVDIKVNTIYISGNNILTDQEIIEIANLDNNPSYIKNVTLVIKDKLEKNVYIKEAKVTKGLLSIKIKIDEASVLYIDKKTNEKVTIKGKIKDEKIVCAPYLINEAPKEKTDGFKNAMTKIDNDMLCQMSEIKYDPNDIDKDRYYVYMNDGNSVYLTVNKFKKLNKYNSILENIGKQNGTLYLDYGDYFEAK